MSLFENFPYTNLHELNLDWLINTLNDLKDQQVISVNGMTGEVVLYENAIVQFPSLADNENWSLIRLVNGTQRGIAFGTDNKAYIVHGNQMGEVYTAGNQPPYPVTRVNGMTGDITLYSDSYVQLPNLTDAQLHNWTIFRNLNSVARGIQINDDGTLAIIAGNDRYTIYSENNPPFTDINGTITFDPVNDPNLEGWIIKRVINNTPVYIQLNDTGTLNFGVGNDFYKIYTTADTENDVIEIPTDTTGSTWGLIRETTEGSVGILFNNDPLLAEPSAYIRYVDSNDIVHTEKLLTQSDIPSSSGVVSVNGYTGVVSLLGSDIQVSSTDTRDVDEAIGDLTATDYAIKDCIAYVENTDTASQNIPANKYVIWKNEPYKSNQVISLGDTLSSTNLTSIPKPAGLTNYIDDKFTPKFIPMSRTSAVNAWVGQAYRIDTLVFVTIYELSLVNSASASDDTVLATGLPTKTGGADCIGYMLSETGEIYKVVIKQNENVLRVGYNANGFPANKKVQGIMIYRAVI